MPGLKKVLHPRQSLNSSNNSESSNDRRWNWSRLFHKRKVHDPNQLITNSEARASRGLHPRLPNALSKEDVGKINASNLEDIVNEDQMCLLCFSLPDVWFSIDSCGCKFCLKCMETYVHCSVRNGQVPIICPDSDCPKNDLGSSFLTENEVKHLVPSDVFPLFLRLLLNREVALNPDLMWCPQPGCETVCSVNQGEKKEVTRKLFGFVRMTRRRRNQSVTCSFCDYHFCAQCKTPWHEKAPCPSPIKVDARGDRKSNENDDPVALLELKGFVKRCPFCQIPIERDEGCAQMMCKNCRHVFCWFCLASLDDDFMLRHYDSGPCRSRLGHSRLSVVWHRTQVVSAFLGLGILFLATSPLILLASPCLLCCLRHHLHSNLSGSNTPENSHDN